MCTTFLRDRFNITLELLYRFFNQEITFAQLTGINQKELYQLAEMGYRTHIPPQPLDSYWAWFEYITAALAGYPRRTPIGPPLLYAPDLEARLRACGVESEST